MKDTLGIIGGMSPKATSYFYDLLIDMTSVSKDQDHIDTIILSHASIPDRTSYILKESKNSPLQHLIKDVKLLNKLKCKIIVITCNTSHYFYNDIIKHSKIPVSNIIEDAIKHLYNQKIKKVGILATTGTIKTKLYQKVCDKYDIKYVLPSDISQQKLMQIIYDDIKLGNKKHYKELINIIKELKKENIEKVILGCTELSILKNQMILKDIYIDPLEIQTYKIIKLFNKEISNKYKYLNKKI